MREFVICAFMHLYAELDHYSKITETSHSDEFDENFLMHVEKLRKIAEEFGYTTTAYHLELAHKTLKPQIRQQFAAAQSFLTSATTSFIHESEKTRVMILNDSAVSNRLKNIESRLPESGNLFFQETVYCLRIEAFRATIVNAWAMCMDYIQEWIVADAARLANFNSELSQRQNKKTQQPIHDAISSKSDFWENRKSPSERVVLDCIEQTVGEKLHRKLVAALDDRNQFAHANSSQLDLDKTKGYISSILDIIEHQKLQ